MTLIRCRKCKAVIAVRSTKFGTRIPPKVRKRMKPVNEDGVEKRLCADCEKVAEAENKK